ncbi:MAG TPA: 3-methyl-2-oxobutanoate hydroxymethyltransferase [Pyrinomonadaceae bacterium]|nr:3-methyl-2-oxobutanoate hydroxymethyltransferase [Chloracidobacterium sp.]MBP9934704.1 3-methyl-2-oxobutanoate hydroxymethyltransferase [Pyrinomonadaceae bacterium]MBK7804590.1 3-methyl-2-oxobutanoate hydroxymethyltransferase [Chloracidobacterium sp.]MBK9439085.1 3-methyl-2-oxobutanoate hydroxymethyltransferase [Chloracidobacterium sp.]MBK9768584.1 3-methyl-2-oxobutanoate hydroxymethyltransferase [Chloracidobacterium sp.]
MAYLQPDKEGKVYLPAIRAAKENGEKLVCLTAYDYPTARIVDEAGVDMILVGDSMGNVIHGYGNTIPVSLDEITSACIAVKRGTERAMVIADMPFGTYHVNEDESVKNALRLMKYGGAEAVKLEGGRNRVELVQRLVNEEIPVVAHIGLTPQSVYKMGGYRVQGRTAEQAKRLIEDAKMLEEAGAFAIVLELVPREVAKMMTNELKISTIGIGAGLDCDIQVLVLHDLVGMTFGRQPRFVRQYANVRNVMTEAIQNWTKDVKSGAYPADAESYGLTEETLSELKGK